MPVARQRENSDTIALILPLESTVYSRAAEAVRAGFIAAADRAGSRSRIAIIGHGDDGVLPAVSAAHEMSAALVVGPLTRDDLKTVLAMAPARPRMLALNQTDDGVALPDDAYSLTLTLDSDAMLLARSAQSDGVRSVSMVVSGTSLQQRFAAAFAAEWRRTGAAPPREYRFDPHPEMLALLRRELASRPTDAVLLSVDSDQAAIAKSFLPPGPVYAVSQIADDLPTPISHDLDRVRYVEIPWLADAGSPELASLPRGNLNSAVLERLYALGLDAFALSQMLAEAVPPERIELDGATGHLSLTPGHSFARQGRIMEIRDGRAQMLAP
ncbi:MAG: penicillin-binding protein activator [Betaproteobacteria bacterium]